MSEFILQHPLGNDLEQIQIAVSLGIVTDAIKKQVRTSDSLPRIKVSYKSPAELGGKVEGIRVADWMTDNMTAIYYPFGVEPGDENWQVISEEGFLPVVQRVHTRDILGRGFPVNMGGTEFISPYLQFDVLEDGIAMVCEDKGEQVVGIGAASSDVYELMADMARHESSISAILRLAEAA